MKAKVEQQPSNSPALASGPQDAPAGSCGAVRKGRKFTPQELAYSRPIRWDRSAMTESGKAAVAAMLAQLEAGETRRRRRRPEDQAHLIGTFTASLLDLYAAAKATPALFLAYPRSSNDYKFGRYGNRLVTLTAVRAITSYLEDAGFTEGEPGFYNRGQNEFGGPVNRGMRTRVRATASLVTALEEAGLRLSDIGQLTTTETIRLKEAAPARRRTKQRIEYADTPETIKQRQALARLNDLLSKTYIDLLGEALAEPENAADEDDAEPLPDINDRTARQLYRVFNNGSFEQGGRFYGGWWQGLRKADRKRLLINGEPTVELDFKSMHPRLCYQFEGCPLPPDVDPYLIPGLPESARGLVKDAVVRLLNAAPGKTPKAPDGAASMLPPGMSWPQLLRRVEAHHRPIAGWFRAGRGMGLQHLDSAIAEVVLSYLTHRGIPCLPVHDSFIVPQSRERQLGQTMMLAYYAQSGKYGAAKVHPVITGWSTPALGALIWDSIEGD